MTFTANSLPSPNAAYTEPLYRLSGMVSLEDTTYSLEGTIVTLQDASQAVWQDTTGTSGEYSFGKLSVGTYNLHFEHLGFEAVDTTLTFSQSVTFELTLMLSSFVLNEDFSENALPYGWMQYSNGTGWLVGDSATLSSDYFLVPAKGIFAAANDDAAGMNNDGSQDYLVTPPLRLSRLQNGILRFESYFTGDFGQAATVEISEDGGNNWTALLQVPGAAEWTEQQVDLADYSGAGHDSVWIAFHSDDGGEWATGWAIDNIRVSEMEKGNIAGTITVNATGAGIDSALVIVGENSVYTDANGAYLIENLLIGQYTLEVQKTGFNTAIMDSVNVLANGTSNVDLALTAPTMDFDVTAIDTTAAAGDSVIVPVTISNNGDGPLNYLVSVLPNTVKKTDYSRFSKGVVFKANAEENVKKGRVKALAETTNGGTVIHYDGDNAAGIGLNGPGSWMSAVRFTAAELGGYYDTHALTEVQIFTSSPDFTNITVKIWEGTVNGEPGIEVYSEDITSAVQVQAWTLHQLQHPVLLNSGEEYWVGYAITATADHPAGADAGPAIAGKGDWLYTDGAWVELTSVNINRNWNIRAMVEQVSSDNWIQANPPGGVVLPGEQAVIEVKLDAAQFSRADSSMSAMLHFVSDPMVGEASIPVNFTVTGITGIDPQNSVPTSFALQQNYPNPFNPTTTIKYQIPSNSEVSLVVYNVMGQKVRTLFSGHKEPGYYSVAWDGMNDNGRKVATGIYIYRLQAGDYVKSFKMLLVK